MPKIIIFINYYTALKNNSDWSVTGFCSQFIYFKGAFYSLHHLLTYGSTAMNGCRQNESPNS